MEKNGSIFIKLGQHLSSLNYLLPSEWCDTFIPLQDQCPVSAFSSVDEMVRHDTGKGLDDYFESFERRPIGAASLAQVHIATLKESGQKVAVKVQHPELDSWAKLDLAPVRHNAQTPTTIHLASTTFARPSPSLLLLDSQNIEPGTLVPPVASSLQWGARDVAR